MIMIGTNTSVSSLSGFVTSFIRRNKLDVAVAPVLETPKRRPYGAFHFSFTMTKGCQYEVQVSRDLKTWNAVHTETAPSERVEYVDTEAPKFSYRFYRVLSGVLQSQAVLGYASVLIPPGFSMVGNPLNSESNDISALFPDLPDKSVIHQYDSAQCRLGSNTMKEGKWERPHDKLAPGEGAIIFNPKDEFRPLNFVGKVLQGRLLNPIPAGFSIRSSMVPQPGRLDADLEFPMSEGDCVHIFDRDKQQYIVYDYPSKQWSQNTPLLGVGEAFWIGKNSPGNWVRNFQVA